MLVKAGCQEIVYRCYTQCAALVRGNALSLGALAHSISTHKESIDLSYALRGDSYMAIAYLRNFDLYGGLKGLSDDSSDDTTTMPSTGSHSIQRSGLPDKTLPRAFLDRYLHYWLELAGNVPREISDLANLLKAREAAVEGELKKENVSDIAAMVLLPDFENLGKQPLKAGAEWETTGALLTALELKAKSGRMPIKASDIPGNWKDTLQQPAAAFKGSGKLHSGLQPRPKPSRPRRR